MDKSNNKIKQKLAKTALDISPSGIRKFFDIASQMPDCISLGVGEPDFVTPWRIIESGVFSLEKGHTHYTSNFGLLELRKEISGYLQSNYSLGYNPEDEIIITIGVSEALDLTLRAILNPGDEVIIAEPYYVSYGPNIQLLHGIAVPVATNIENEFQLKSEDIKKAISKKTKAIILNSPNNPSGAVIQRKELEKIAKLVKENNIFVIADEIYGELVYETEPQSISSLSGMKDHSIFLNGFSKSYAMTGWRIGYVCAHKDVIEIMMKIHQYTTLCAPVMGQMAAIEALRHGKNDRDKMREQYLRRRNLISRRFKEIGFNCPLPGGAFYVFPDVSNSGLASETFAEKLLYEQKVAVIPGNVFGSSGKNNIRCSYATSIEKIKIAMERIETFLNSIKS